ncbi:MAG TPA: sigma-70 family RNA polymerase sigma factor [Patescibacteria group bacterium]|nr:sigma-70 family RNA polymerase sigma factor [Patescibacteria group bacterium]
MFARAAAHEREEPGTREDGMNARTAASRAGSKIAGGGDPIERGLIEAAQRDRAKFAELYEANFERVYAYVARRVRDRDEAQDLTADVFHLALKNLARFEWRGVPFAAWLFRIASNEIADRSKNVARRRAHGDPHATELAADGGIGVAAGFEEAERRSRLFKLVDGLPRDQSRVIAMRFAEDKSIREIASALKRSEGSIKQLQFRGLQNLRLRMGDPNG